MNCLLKKGCLLLLFVLLMMACSCAKTEEEYVNHRYLYISNKAGAIVSVDVQTGMAQYVCPDPLCPHTADVCEYVEENGDGVLQAGRYVFYNRNSKDIQPEEMWLFSIWRYDCVTGETKSIFDRHTLITDMTVVDGCLYFNSAQEVMSDDPEETGETHMEYDIYRYTIASERIERLNTEVFLSAQSLDYGVDGRLFWTDYSVGGDSYNTNYLYRDRRETTEEDWIKNCALQSGGTEEYYLIVETVQTMYQCQRRMDKKTGEISDFVPLCAGAVNYGDKLIYMTVRDEPLQIGEYSDGQGRVHPVYHYVDNTIYIKNINTLEEKSVDYDIGACGGLVQSLANMNMSPIVLDNRYTLVTPLSIQVADEDGNMTLGSVDTRILLDMEQATVQYVEIPV